MLKTSVVLLVLGLLLSAVTSKVLRFKSGDKFHEQKYGMEPDAYRDAAGLITSKGFPCQNHYVTTKDGYILNVLRIPHGRKNNADYRPGKPRYGQTTSPRTTPTSTTRTSTTPTSTTPLPARRPVVYLQHGLLGSCTNFLTNLVNQSLAYLLADAGADVWLGNSRGTIYSLNHKTLSSHDDKFWEFTFDEMAKYDLPATIQFIVETTGQDQIYYVGHSQGTAIAFAEFSQNPEIASFIKHFFALAPIARVGNMKSPIRLLAPFSKDIYKFLSMFGHGEFLLEPEFLRHLQGDLCSKWREEICANIMFLAGGFDASSMNMSRVPVYTSHNPAGTSTRNVLHFAQEVNTGQFQMFDFGSDAENMNHYGQKTPPLFYPANMTVPVALFRGGKDWLADDVDVDWLKSQLPKVTDDVYIPHYEHLDLIWAFDSPAMVYKKILQIIFGH